MSSLMQFDGVVGAKGVQLIAYLTREEEVVGEGYSYKKAVDVEIIPGTNLPVLYTFWRKPKDMWGPWVVFRYNGEDHAPDLSIPLHLEKLPRDAERMGDQAAIRYWLSPDPKSPPKYKVCYRRIGERDRKIAKLLGTDATLQTIPYTAYPELWYFEMEDAMPWHEGKQEDEDLWSFEMMPPGAIKIGNQAALRFWLHNSEGSEPIED